MEKVMAEQEQLRMLNGQEDEVEIGLKEIFFLILNNWKSVLLAVLIGAVIFTGYRVFLMNPSYQADTKIYITNTDSTISFSDLQLSSALTEDYGNIIKSRTVLNRVIDQLDLKLNYEQLGKLVSVENPDSTHIIHTLVTCDDLELSRNIANALMYVSIEQIQQIVGSSEPTVIDYSEAEAVQDVTPGLIRYPVMGGMLGGLLVCAVLIVRMLMNTTMKTEEDITKYLGIPMLAAVPYFKER
ncbi:MAG: Wzz/FepE/Etk N-terminal domain-containing protein [Lachnospiraceae bacterium]|nr:Wzz/FepE/Etk N-terminal domain-containing protein [Lachnospiraceae bacterium]